MPTRKKSRKLLIAIDGPAGSGKSSTAKALAKRLKVPFIDTGAMYRSVTLRVMEQRIPFSDKKKMIQAAKSCRIELKGSDPAKQRVYLDGREVTKDIRLPELTKNVFHIAQEPGIRRVLVKFQQKIGKKQGGVMEGRDIGTVVFPDADFKFFFEASHAIRARRRLRELLAVGQKATLQGVLKDIKRRDKTDTSRKEGPLKCAKDAIVIDTTPLTIDQTVDKMIGLMGLKPLKSGQLS